ncbi:MAG: hypothetical protein GY854_05655 [Deltaproteobacteria bacterium]|nr:hypothetical protein [Deltaproteobacteria bacterium]
MLSADQKKPGGADDLKKKLGVGGGKLPGALPGLGAKPSNAPLPGLGGPPSKAPLPGIGGQPGGAPLPGVAKPGGLPGAAAKPGIVPPFMQQPEPEPEAPKGPNPEQVARDPFGAAPPPSQTAVRPSFAPDQGLIGSAGDASVSFSEGEAGKSRLPIIIGGLVIGFFALLIGYFTGTGRSGRVELNIAIRDAFIVEYEIKKAAKLFNEIQTVANAALNKATKREYETTHIPFLTQKVKGNPIKPNVFTDRNYKKFDPAAVQWLMDYNQKWFKLDKLIQEHRKQTKYDEAALKAAKEQFQKLLQTQYGVVFARNKQSGGQLSANLIVMGPGTEEGMFKVQADTGTFADERAIYNPAPDVEENLLSKEPEKYVIPVGEQSKGGLLQNATQSHFKKYGGRLKEITDLMKGMVELQKNLLGKLSEICSQDPVIGGGFDPIEAFEEYKQNDQAAPSE